MSITVVFNASEVEAVALALPGYRAELQFERLGAHRGGFNARAGGLDAWAQDGGVVDTLAAKMHARNADTSTVLTFQERSAALIALGRFRTIMHDHIQPFSPRGMRNAPGVILESPLWRSFIPLAQGVETAYTKLLGPD